MCRTHTWTELSIIIRVICVVTGAMLFMYGTSGALDWSEYVHRHCCRSTRQAGKLAHAGSLQFVHTKLAPPAAAAPCGDNDESPKPHCAAACSRAAQLLDNLSVEVVDLVAFTPLLTSRDWIIRFPLPPPSSLYT